MDRRPDGGVAAEGWVVAGDAAVAEHHRAAALVGPHARLGVRAVADAVEVGGAVGIVTLRSHTFMSEVVGVRGDGVECAFRPSVSRMR